MFHFDRGLMLTKADLAIDFRRRQPRGYISHAHSDHMAPHQYALCTPATARLYRHRFGPREILELPYRRPLEWGGLRLTTFPAGHCLGSAMLLAEDGDSSLLYTGDFKLAASLTAEQAELPRADVLIIECTFGNPAYRLIPREAAIERLIAVVRTALADEATPVIQAYTLGKSQEVTAILAAHGIPVLQHRLIHAVSRVYESCGVRLGKFDLLDPENVPPGSAVVVPPRMHRPGHLPRVRRQVTVAVTGWAAQPAARYRWGVDHAIPLSDHADYDDLFAAVERVSPRVIYCTHGPDSFADCLRRRGFNAYPLGKACQLRLF